MTSKHFDVAAPPIRYVCIEITMLQWLVGRRGCNLWMNFPTELPLPEFQGKI